jgi:hypothetical protein
MIWIVSLFGGKMSPERSIKWWFFLIFLVFSATSPVSLIGVTHLLGITLISNFVFAVIILFLIFQTIELSVLLTKSQLEQRSVVTALASNSFKGGNSGKKSLILLPCYNEEKSLPTMILRLQKLCLEFPEFQFCFVNDGSRDNSKKILDELCPNNYVSHLTNQGVSGAILTGFRIAESLDYDYLIQCDSDGQHPTDLIPALLNKAIEIKSDLHIGSRFLPDFTSKISGIE